MTQDVFAAYHGEKHDRNDLTSAAISLCPAIENIISTLETSEGCTSAMMSGSGSACFGVFDTFDNAETAGQYFKNKVVTKVIDNSQYVK